MARQTEARQVTARLFTSEGSEKVLRNVVISNRVNSLPVVTYQEESAVRAREGTAAVDWEKIVEENRRIQEQGFEFPAEPQERIHVHDGRVSGGFTGPSRPQVNLQGFVTRPSLAVVNGMIEKRRSFLHQNFRFSAFNPSFYVLHPTYLANRRQGMSGVFAGILGEDYSYDPASSLLARLGKILRRMHDDNAALYAAEADSSDPSIVQRRAALEVNEQIAGEVIEFLENQPLAVLDRELFPAADPALKGGISNSGIDAVLSRVISVPAFDQGLASVLFREFLLQMTCDLSDGSVTVQPSRIPYIDDEADLAVDEWVDREKKSLGFDLLPVWTLPVTRVGLVHPRDRYVSAPAGQENSRHAFSSLNTFAGYYPENAGIGRFLMLQCPEWLKKSDVPLPPGAASLPIPPDGHEQYDYDLDTCEQVIGLYEQEEQKREAFRNDALNGWTRLLYRMNALDRTTGVVSMPLNLGIQIGRHYRVRNKEGVHLFSGYLDEVLHTIDAERREAHTQLTFRHIRSPGFTIP